MEQLRLNSQWKSFIRHCAQNAKNGLVVDLDCGITVCWTRSNLIFTNAFFLSCAVSDEADLRRRLEEIKAYVRKAEPTFPWVFCVEPELLSDDLYKRLREICLTANLEHSGNFECMQTTTTSLLPPVRPLPVAKIKFATSQQDVYDAVLLNAQAYHMDARSAENVVEHRAFVTEFDKQLCCLALLDDKPVSTATALILDDCLYVAFVATSLQHRKHGYAELALRASVERALGSVPNTHHDIVLHSTEPGQPVYERMGFKHISHIEMYVQKSVVPV